jgi:predicted phosphohydrolase
MNNYKKSLLQVCSDLHLENNDIKESDFPNIIKPVASILVLAGDIGDPFSPLFEQFLCYCSKHFQNVLFVTGNHEYYNYSINEVDNKINKLCEKYKNFHFLNNGIFQYEDLYFIGTTLWTDINSMNNYDLISVMVDYRKIINFTPELQKKLFKQNVEFIEKHLYDKKCIVITHHAPSYNCIEDKFKDDKFRHCFASKLDYLLENNNLVGWIYGHLHNNYKVYNKNNFLYANCYRTKNYLNNVPVL